MDPQKRDGFARQVVANAPSPHVLAAYTALTDTGYIYASIGASDVMKQCLKSRTGHKHDPIHHSCILRQKHEHDATALR